MKNPNELEAIKKLIGRVDHVKKSGSRDIRFTVDETDDMIRDFTLLLTHATEQSQYIMHLQKMLQKAQQALSANSSSSQDGGGF